MASIENSQKKDEWPIKISTVFSSISNQIIHSKMKKKDFFSDVHLDGEKIMR